MDEFVFGVREAAWPLLRADFHLSYTAIGILLTVPSLIGCAIEPAFGLLGDTGRRRAIILGGGIAFSSALALTGFAWGVLPLLAGFALLNPASGAFVSLSQATLMDLQPARRETNMARWTLAGQVGVVVGPLALAGALALGLGWRQLLLALAVATAPLVVLSRSVPLAAPSGQSLHGALRSALAALKRASVLRWLVLLELTDLMGDVLTGFLALYFVDVARVSPQTATVAVVVWSAAGLAGDALLLPLLERVPGTAYLRVSAAAALIVLPALLLVPAVAPKLALLALLGLLRAGWYAIPQGRLFSELPGASGTAVALADVSGLLGKLSPLAIGLLAQRFGLGHALWLMLLAPLGLLVVLRREGGSTEP